ncbi:hypothetical protein AnigIFM63604_005879 [Aspergillus niger]|uniref:Peptidase C14 caspase domain-containing protein n=1 Tax=Aspergillus niger TaxID=5061 RepID=A0A9W5ZXU3_ASPNG|nr:hypothetical protein AnigIFM63604_005879 [Aspergillus niger]
MTHRWAILIGVDFNKDPKFCLSGAVRDVANIKEYLQSNDSPLEIIALTASIPSDPADLNPTEPQELLPTYGRITAVMDEIARAAKEGDFFYMHFSGHGTRLPAAVTRHNKDTNGDFALVLVDEAADNAYFEGTDLAERLDILVKKGVKVTLVLDCCFSGSSSRQGQHGEDGMVRTIGYRDLDHSTAAASASRAGSEHQASAYLFRDADFVPQWLLKPDGYGILTACGPHERAKELKYNGQKNGALTFFLCQTLRSLKAAGVEASHQFLYLQTCVQFRSNYPLQHPMRYGNPQHLFFGGQMTTMSESTVAVFRPRRGKGLYLTAGYVHGVHIGDEYILSSLNGSNSSPGAGGSCSVKARVMTAQGLTSELGPANFGESLDHVEAGWTAKLCSSQATHRIYVRLLDTVPSQDEWMKQSSSRETVRILTEHDQTPAECIVDYTAHQSYRLVDTQGEEFRNFPSIKDIGSKTVATLLDFLEHLGAFKYVEKVKNNHPDPEFERSFKISLLSTRGKQCSGPGNISTEDCGEVTLKMENIGPRTLYVVVLDLCPSWKIVSLVQNDGGGDYIPIPPASQDSRRFKMTVPSWAKMRGIKRCKDVIKLFITDEPVSFNSLLLPEAGVLVRGFEPRRTHYIHYNKWAFFDRLTRSGAGYEVKWSSKSFPIITEDRTS